MIVVTPFDRNAGFDAYIIFVVYYALVKLILIGMLAFHKGLTPELAIKLIQSFSRTVDTTPPTLTGCWNSSTQAATTPWPGWR